MSVRVLSEVWRASRSELGARLVLLALADCANDDGVGWPAQGDHRNPEWSLRSKTRLSERAIRDALESLKELGEIEVRKAQRGRHRVNVYRVVLGRIGETPVQYDRLPFTLSAPFSEDRQELPVVKGRRPDISAGHDRTNLPVACKDPSLDPRLSETDVSSSPAAPPPRTRDRDPLWDAVASSVYGTLELSRALGRETGVATCDLRAQGVEPVELPAIVKAYRKRFRDAAISASAIAKWAPVLRSPAGASVADRYGRAERFVRNVGFEYDNTALRDELARFSLPPDELPRLLELAEQIRRSVA